MMLLQNLAFCLHCRIGLQNMCLLYAALAGILSVVSAQTAV